MSVEDLLLRRHVERRGRLVGDQQGRVERERRGDHDALALAARDLVRVDVVELLGIGQMRRRHDLEHARAARGGVHVRMNAQHFVDLRAAGLHGIERGHRLLEDHRHAGAAQLCACRPRACRRDSRLAARCAPPPRQSSRAKSPMTEKAVTDLPEPGLADDADDLARRDIDRQLLYGEGPVRAGGQAERRGIGWRGRVGARRRRCCSAAHLDRDLLQLARSFRYQGFGKRANASRTSVIRVWSLRSTSPILRS